MTDRRSAPPKSTNQKSILLNAEENNRLFGLIGQKRFTLASAVVQLVTADPPHFNTWVKKCCGVATFIKDNGKRTYFICVYDLKSGQCLWTQELYNQFTYHAVEDYFHYFEAHDCPAGLNFANEDEANLFRKAVLDKLAERKARREEKRRTQAHGLDSSRVPNYQPPPPPPSQNANNFSSTTNQFGPKVTSGNMTVKGKKDKDKDKKGKIKKEDISNPTNFTHVQHMGWDASGTMQETAIDLKDPDLIQLFQRVNVYDITTLDPNFVQDFVKKSGGMDAVRNDNKRYGSTRPTAPAPPPVVPPAPPRSMSVSAAPPPPPPSSAPAPAPPPRTLQQPAPAPQAPHPQPPSRPPPGPPELPSAPPSRARHVAPAAPSALRPKNPPARPPPGPPPAPPSGAFSSAPPPPPPPIGAPPPPPPPPPPPAANNAPLPPPPPSISMPSVDDSGRGDLLASIRAGAKLKTVTATDAPAAPTDARSNLLSDIVNKGSKTLRAVDQTIKVEAPQEEDTGLAGALARALKDRQAKMTGDDDDDSQSEEDDAEWDD